MVQLDVVSHVLDEDVHVAIEQAAELGVPAIEFYHWQDADPEAVAETAAGHGVTIVSTLAGGAASNIAERDQPSMTDPTDHETVVTDLEDSIEVAQELETNRLVATVGPDHPEFTAREQRRSIVDALNAVAPSAESAGVTIALEPLNTAVDHPGYFLVGSDQAFELVERINSESVKVLYDVYHQQITEGNLTEQIRDNIDLIGHFHVADVPGRHEPGTGEIDYAHVFDVIDDLDYDGYVGCEFGPTESATDALQLIKQLLA
jgi:hydroxypyruvate isomerase